MSEFAGESASSGQQMAVAYYAAAYACAERKDYEIPESGGGAVCHFSYGGSVGVVADDGSEPGAAFHHVYESDGRGPGQIGGALDASCRGVGARRADSDSLYHALKNVVGNHTGYLRGEIVGPFLHSGCARGDRVVGHNMAYRVHYRKCGIGSSEIHSHCEWRI